MTDVGLEYVIMGNDVYLKCKIPSFVTDFVSIISWGFVNHEKTSGTFEEISNEGKAIYQVTCTNRAFY